jgi:predicted small metal-binding protein
MGYRYTCSDTGTRCGTTMEDEQEDRLRRQVEDHLRREHPDTLVDKEKTDRLLMAGVRRI